MSEKTDHAPAKPTRRGLAMRDIVLLVMLAVVFGFLYWALVQAWNALAIAMGPGGDLAQHILFGGWLLVAPIAIAIIRYPGVGVIAEVIAAVVEVVFLGSPVGPMLLLSATLQGLGSELPFTLTRYRRFGWGIYALSGACGAAAVFVLNAFRSGWWGQSIILARFGIQAVSGLVLGGLLAKVIVEALRSTGVLDDFAIVREGAQRSEDAPWSEGTQRSDGAQRLPRQNRPASRSTSQHPTAPTRAAEASPHGESDTGTSYDKYQ
ncbi:MULTISPECIES: ECF transporter S component [unclassified Actinobaculum]|uniref:ECF transporter S component n=1 Tax=unclassified Actinobaculum TaxID=2609299 RepID=UPI000D5261B6|nr:MULTISPECIES: ECF transporter S component [unclassified Actinobaculum]AWE43094.1 thiamine ABC transporter permease [Actinobaculum sp. 313]RTE48520.1 thiamine ABC transporter permease [Actinobaculum sp. 352]